MLCPLPLVSIIYTGSFSLLMTIALAATFNPRGEIPRLLRLYAQIEAVYPHRIISLPPTASPVEIDQLKALSGTQVIVNEDWSHGRYTALKAAFETGTNHLHYVDLDRLI